MTRAESRRIYSACKQFVYISEPHVSSYANLTLLNKFYLLLDKTIYSPLKMLSIRKKWFKSLMETPDELGGLTCKLCGCKGLLPKAPKNQLATLDHIVDIGNGGSWNDPSNFQVACYKCNIAKSSKKKCLTSNHKSVEYL